MFCGLTYYIASEKLYYWNYSADRGPHIGQPWSMTLRQWVNECDHPLAQRHILGERNPQPHRFVNLKARKMLFVCCTDRQQSQTN